jgi:Fic family protein
LPEPAASGRLRSFAVGIGNSVYVPFAIPQEIEDLFSLILAKAEQVDDPFEQAFFVMVHLPYLQPFDDVNKRVSRLAANIPLNRRNLAPLAFIDVPMDLYISGLLGVYELNRTELLKDIFLWAYERSALKYAAIRQSLGEPDSIKAKYRDQIKSLVRKIVLGLNDQRQARSVIAYNIANISDEDKQRFIELVETELYSLHDGNIAIYWILPKEFTAWKDTWDE